MTFLLLTEDPRQGQALSSRLATPGSGNLCLVMPPADAADALREVRVDRVVCPPAMTDQLRAAVPAKSPPRFLPWPEQLSEEALQGLRAE